MKALQEEREEKLIRILKNRLEPYVKGQKDDFVESAKLEAQRLSQAGTCFRIVFVCEPFQFKDIFMFRKLITKKLIENHL